MTSFSKSIGEKIVMARQAAGISQTKLAKSLGITQQSLSIYERGINALPLKVFVDICTALDAPLSWFLPSVKQYGEVISRPDTELLHELHKIADSETLLSFIKKCSAKKNDGKKSRCIARPKHSKEEMVN